MTIDVRGRTVQRLVLTRDVLWYGVNPKQLVRLVIVRDPNGIEPDDFFVTTDLSASGADVASRYAGRWSIEVCFRDTKQDLGGEPPNPGSARDPHERPAYPYGWHLTEHPAGDTWIPQTLVSPQEHPQLARRPRRAPTHTLVPANYHYVSRGHRQRPHPNQNCRRPTRHARLRRLRLRKTTSNEAV